MSSAQVNPSGRFFNSANTNYVTADHYGAFSQPGASGGENAGHGIMQFDLSPIPTGTAITSAKLDLYGRGAWGAGDAGSVGNIGQADSYLERITSAWDENLVTWNTAPTITNQNAILLPAAASAVQDYLNINVTQLVQDMVDNPNSSFGFSLRLVTEDPTRALVFCSSDFTDVSKHPRLTVTICGETGINETSAATHIVNVYPNPAGDYFTINLNHAIVTKPVAEIFDVFGKLVAKQNLNSNETVISRNGWSSGVYFYRIKTGDAILDQGKVVLR